jgi:hypothetical protein
MLKKHLFTISLLLPLVAISATANAGSTITDKSYWPSEARRSAQINTGGSQSEMSSAFAFDRGASQTRDERERWRMALSGRPKISLTPANRALHHSRRLCMDHSSDLSVNSLPVFGQGTSDVG